MASVSRLMKHLNVVSHDEQLHPRVTKTTLSLSNSIWKFLTEISVEPQGHCFLNSVAFWTNTFLLENRNLSVVSIRSTIEKSTCRQLLFPVQSGKDCGIWWKLLYIKKNHRSVIQLWMYCFVCAKTKPIVLLLSSCLSELSWKWQTTSAFRLTCWGKKVKDKPKSSCLWIHINEMKCFIRQYSHLKLSCGSECFHPYERNLKHNKWIMKYRKLTFLNKCCNVMHQLLVTGVSVVPAVLWQQRKFTVLVSLTRRGAVDGLMVRCIWPEHHSTWRCKSVIPNFPWVEVTLWFLNCSFVFVNSC